MPRAPVPHVPSRRSDDRSLRPTLRPFSGPVPRRPFATHTAIVATWQLLGCLDGRHGPDPAVSPISISAGAAMPAMRGPGRSGNSKGRRRWHPCAASTDSRSASPTCRVRRSSLHGDVRNVILSPLDCRERRRLAKRSPSLAAIAPRPSPGRSDYHLRTNREAGYAAGDHRDPQRAQETPGTPTRYDCYCRHSRDCTFRRTSPLIRSIATSQFASISPSAWTFLNPIRTGLRRHVKAMPEEGAAPSVRRRQLTIRGETFPSPTAVAIYAVARAKPLVPGIIA